MTSRRTPRIAFAGVVRDALRGDARAFDPDSLERRDVRLIRDVLPFVRAFNARYVRLASSGLEHVRPQPALYVGNHNGGIAGPDLLATLGTLWDALGPDFPLHALAHDFAMRQLAPLGRAIQRFGAIRASHANARRAIAAGHAVLVYPGGEIDAFRHFRRRDEIVFGARTGFVRLAQESGVPIVPIVAHGAHRSAVIVSEGASIARMFGMKRWARIERFPIAIAAPWGLALGPWIPYLPLPFRVTLRVLPPMFAPRDADPQAIRESVRVEMQHALDALARDAGSPG